jgi:hypothetical protein
LEFVPVVIPAAESEPVPKILSKLISPVVVQSVETPTDLELPLVYKKLL